jgi:hypothetical protein
MWQELAFSVGRTSKPSCGQNDLAELDWSAIQPSFALSGYFSKRRDHGF